MFFFMYTSQIRPSQVVYYGGFPLFVCSVWLSKVYLLKITEVESQ